MGEQLGDFSRDAMSELAGLHARDRVADHDVSKLALGVIGPARLLAGYLGGKA